jgi:hypothetical protein
MIDPEDPRVKDLQQLAWGLQTLSNKPGNRLPEDYRRECYKLASRAINLCSDIAYTEEQDFAERSEEFVKQIHAKKKHAQEVEEAEKAKLVGKCFRADSSGNYTVGNVADRSRTPIDSTSGEAKSLISTAGGVLALTASEVVARCKEDPEALFLCDLGLGDSDMEQICQGLKQAGSTLTSLDLSHNLLADVGVQKLVTALASGACPKLKELHISHNSFGELGKQILQGGLTKLRRDLVVDIDACDDKHARDDKHATAQPAQERLVTNDDHVHSSQEVANGLESPQPAQERFVTNDDHAHSSQEVANGLESPTDSGECCSVEQEVSTSGAIDIARPEAADVQQESVINDINDNGIHVEFVRSKDLDELQLRVVLALPDSVTSAADMDVDISAWNIIARTTAGSLLSAKLPCAVVADSAQAVFSRKRRTMTFTLHPVDAVEAAALHDSGLL